jgi:hypothetical protein
MIVIKPMVSTKTWMMKKHILKGKSRLFRKVDPALRRAFGVRVFRRNDESYITGRRH